MEDFSKLLGIDKVYCISLKKNENKWNDILSKISENGFPNPVIFEGISGASYKGKPDGILGVWEEYILKNNLDRNNHEHFSTWGGLGCYLSHVSIWQDVKKNKYNNVLIFEDDIEFKDDFKNSLKTRIPYIPTDYDFLFLDVAHSFESKDVNEYFKKIKGLFFGLHSYIITNKAIDALLPRIFPVEIQLDSYVSYMSNIAGLNLYFTDELCGQEFHASTIQTICINCDAKHQLKAIKTIFLFIIILLVIFLLFTFVYMNSYLRKKSP